jgi:hypothetical protein
MESFGKLDETNALMAPPLKEGMTRSTTAGLPKDDASQLVTRLQSSIKTVRHQHLAHSCISLQTVKS